jgi:hypothetical protein
MPTLEEFMSALQDKSIEINNEKDEANEVSSKQDHMMMMVVKRFAKEGLPCLRQNASKNSQALVKCLVNLLKKFDALQKFCLPWLPTETEMMVLCMRLPTTHALQALKLLLTTSRISDHLVQL